MAKKPAKKPVQAPPAAASAPAHRGSFTNPAHQYFAQKLSMRQLPKDLMEKYQGKTLTPKDITDFYVKSLGRYNQWNDKSPTSEE